jgi:hypothetical protein
MYLPRKRLFPLILVGALLGTPALAAAHTAGAHTLADRPPAIQPATLTARKRSRRSRRARVRTIVWRITRRARDSGTSRADSETVQPRLAPHDSYARGPPGSTPL